MKNTTRGIARMALALSLAAVPLTGCAGQTAQPAQDGTATDAIEQPAAAPADVSSWKTLGDALAAQTESLASSTGDEYYVAVFQANDSIVRVVAKMDADVSAKLDELDILDKDYDQKFREAAGGLELVSAEDVTDDALTQEELDALVGKTGQELVDEGFTFMNYFFYGAEGEAGATMDKGYFAYGITFATTVTDEQTEDEGAAIMDAKVLSAERVSASDAAIDPVAVQADTGADATI